MRTKINYYKFKNRIISIIFIFVLFILDCNFAYAVTESNQVLVIVEVGNSTFVYIHPLSAVGAASETSVDDIKALYTIDNPAGLAVTPVNPAVFKRVKKGDIQYLKITGLQYGTYTINVRELHQVYATETATDYTQEEVDYNVIVHVIHKNDLLLRPNQAPSGSAPVSGLVAAFPGPGFPGLGFTKSTDYFFYTTKAVYLSLGGAILTNFGKNTYSIYIAPDPRQIVDVKAKGHTEKVHGALFDLERISWELVVLLDDGTVVVIPIIQTDLLVSNRIGDIRVIPNESKDPKNQENFKKICGDDLYTISDKAVYRLRTDTSRWELDSSGLSLKTNSPADITIDTAQNVYTAIGKTFFTQALTENAWHSVSQLPANVNALFVDRRNRLFAGTGGTAGKNGVYRSNDLGKTWQLGNSGMGDNGIYALGDDAYGNIYAVTDSGDGTGNYGGRIYRSADGGMNWTRIDQPIRSQFNDHTISHFFNAVSGDSLLFAATILGVFASSDQGNTWQLAPNAVASENAFGFLKLGSTTIASNLQGIFYTTDNDSMWHHSYPVGSFLSGSELWSDNNGAAYMLRQPTEKNQFKGITLKAPVGLIWAEDTAGLYKLSFTDVFCVDEFGNQHVPGFTKLSGGSWQSETMNISASSPKFIGSDRDGSLYLSSGNVFPTESGILISRSIEGGAWKLDTAGLGGALITNIVRQPSKQRFALSYSGKIFTRVGGVWQQLPSPLPAKILGGSISADSTGAIMVTGWNFASNYGQISGGVWVSKDQGKNWRSAGLDSVYISGLVSYGDSTFCLSDGGIYVIHSTFKPVIQIVAPDTIDFGDVLLGKSRDTSFQIANLGTDPLHITDITISAPFTIKKKSYTIDVDSWATDTIHFAPVAEGPSSSTITTTGDGGNGKKFIVKGNGTKQSGGGVKNITEDGYSLAQNNPNPFKTSTTIRYRIPNHEHVRLTLLDPLGKQLAILFEGEADSGEHDLIISAHDLASGIYIVRMEAGGVTKTQMICVVK